MENWIISSTDRKAHIVLACITCENVVLLTAETEILREQQGKTMDLFLPTVCMSCEEDERRKVLPLGKSTAMWTSLSISHNMIRPWQPFSAMNALLGGELCIPLTKVKLVRRGEVRDMVGSDYVVQSVLLDRKTGRAEVHKYLHTGFF